MGVPLLFSRGTPDQETGNGMILIRAYFQAITTLQRKLSS